MIVKAENHLLRRPIHNFAEPQTYVGETSCSLLHAQNKCSSPSFGQACFYGNMGPFTSPVMADTGTFLGSTPEAFGKHAQCWGAVGGGDGLGCGGHSQLRDSSKF